jgi:tRNA(fMet)-specific endonuclease VapC
MLDALLGAVQLLPFSVEDARAAAAVRSNLRRSGRPMGPFDILLAGTALAQGLSFVTANTKELARIEGLSLLDWRVA